MAIHSLFPSFLQGAFTFAKVSWQKLSQFCVAILLPRLLGDSTQIEKILFVSHHQRQGTLTKGESSVQYS
jgi:hypothetical protein